MSNAIRLDPEYFSEDPDYRPGGESVVNDLQKKVLLSALTVEQLRYKLAMEKGKSIPGLRDYNYGAQKWMLIEELCK